jgi:predicted nucleic acid-binding protein
MYSSRPACFDSNIWIYSFNTTSSKYKTACDLRKKAVEGLLHVYLTPQIITESFRALTDKRLFAKPRTPTEAMKQLTVLQSALPRMYPNSKTFTILSSLVKKHPTHIQSLTIYDAFLVATMLTHDITTLYTDNTKDFKYYEEITVINPFGTAS